MLSSSLTPQVSMKDAYRMKLDKLIKQQRTLTEQFAMETDPVKEGLTFKKT